MLSRKTTQTTAMIIGCCGSAFTVLALNIYPVDPLILRSCFLFATSAIAFFVWPSWGNDTIRINLYDLALFVGSAVVCVYTVVNYEGLIERAGVLPTKADVVMGIILIITVLEMARRTMGSALPILGLAVILYALFGSHFPGMFRHPGFLLERVVSQLYGNEGVFGIPVAVTVTYVFMFVLFGAFMDACGAGAVLIDIAMAIAGRFTGGAAKIAVIASSFFGSINGSPVANVTATGTFTIPLMIKSKYQPAFAGAVEAAASTGGQILPPIMGASVFIMMEILGIPYVAIAKAAVIPALLYYLGVFWTVDLEARKSGLAPLPADQVPKLRGVLRTKGYLLIPILILVYYLVIVQVSPLRAALWGIVSCLIISWFRKTTRLGPKKIATALYVAAKGSVMVMAACAVAGMIVGVLGLTGLGLNMANIIIGYSGGYLPLTLLLATIVTLILGIGMPTTGSYIIGATIIAPALVKLGVLPLAAHLFVLYFANISNITPPVALAAYAAAGISGSNPLSVGVKAFKLGLAAVLLPYAWVYGPQLIMEGGIYSILIAAVTGCIGVLALGVSTEGYLGKKHLNWVSRTLLFFSAVLLIIPGARTDSIAMGLIVVSLLIIWKSPYKRLAAES